jgi:hypothetical protein
MTPDPDVVAQLALRLSGGGKWHAQMLVPDDYKKAIQNAVTAPDFDAKQKYAQEAQKLMIDKYALMIMLSAGSDSAASHQRVKNHGFMATPNTGQWSPEDAWIAK